MLRKLNLKKDRLVDIRSVLKIDERPFKPIPYEEWRTQLKKCVRALSTHTHEQ
jgi:hypothetical protein